MNFKSIIGCVCVCFCLTPTIVSATTVWSTDMFSNGGSEWKLYVVTTEDALGPAMTPTAVYIDNVSFGAHAIDPMMLLTNPILDIVTEAVTANDYWDIMTGFSFNPDPFAPTISFNYTADMPAIDPDGMEYLYDEFQLNVTGPMFQVALSYDAFADLRCGTNFDYVSAGCNLLGDQFLDPTTGGFLSSFDIWSYQQQWFTPVATIVPLPAAVWLFGSGILGLIGVARRKAHT